MKWKGQEGVLHLIRDGMMIKMDENGTICPWESAKELASQLVVRIGGTIQKEHQKNFVDVFAHCSCEIR